jgi:(2Fe-2S) ferredoxin
MSNDTSPSKAVKARRGELLICAGTGCVSNRSFKVRDALIEELKKHGLSEEVQVVATGCQGFCAQGPIMIVQPDGIFYQMLTVDNIPKLVEEHLVKGATSHFSASRDLLC